MQAFRSRPTGRYAVIIILCLLAFSALGQTSGKSPLPDEWQALNIIDVTSHPWDQPSRFASRTKSFFRTPDEGSLIYVEFSPTWKIEPGKDRLGPHYHYFHEWAYLLSGDFVIHEPVSPYQKHGAAYRFVEGTWLDRPAYTLHGGDWETGGLRPQNPSRMIIMEEGDGGVVTFGPTGDHFKPDFPDSRPKNYDPDWQKVSHFPRPWIIDSSSALEWEWDSEVAGRMVKWLSDDGNGFRARMIKIPPGWSAPETGGKQFYRNAHRLRYMLYGDMQVWSFAGPNDTGKAMAVNQDDFIHQPPDSLWGYGDGPVTQQGAVWLEVTYSHGLKVGGGPIESPVQIP